MFVHGGILHIGFNMWAFWNLGRLAERVFGRWTYLLVYLATGLGSSVSSLFVHPVEVSVGASGAIFGVAGALITALKLGKLGIPAQNLKAIIRSLILFAFYNLAFGAAVPFIDNAAHVGGFLFGLLAGALLSKSLTADPESRTIQKALVFVVLVSILLASGYAVQRTRGWVVAKYKPAVEQQVNQGK
jgi:rhomboid protease GluP